MFSLDPVREQDHFAVERKGLIVGRDESPTGGQKRKTGVFELIGHEQEDIEDTGLRQPKPPFLGIVGAFQRLFIVLAMVSLVLSFGFGYLVASFVSETSNGYHSKPLSSFSNVNACLSTKPHNIEVSSQASIEASDNWTKDALDTFASDSSFHYLQVTDEERADFVWRFVNKRNTAINYWDRRTKFQIMSLSAFNFFRGTASLYWYDFGKDSRLDLYGSSLSLLRKDTATINVTDNITTITNDTILPNSNVTLSTWTWLSGDCHVYNFGSMGSTEEEIYYGLNDFDESIFGDYQLDLWRLGISIVLVVRSNNSNVERMLKKNSSKQTLEKSINEDELRDIIFAMSDEYIQQMMKSLNEKSHEPHSGGWNHLETTMPVAVTRDNAYGLLKEFLLIVEQKYSRSKMLDKWAPQTSVATSNDTGESSYQRQFDLSSPKLGSVTVQERETLENAMQSYFSYLQQDDGIIHEYDKKPLIDKSSVTILDVARRLDAGTGSLGCDRFYVLVKDATQQPIVRILDVKEQAFPASYAYTSGEAKAVFENLTNEGTNAALGFVQAPSALSFAGLRSSKFVGFVTIRNRHFSVMERSPYKNAFPALHEDAVKKFKNLKLRDVQDYQDLVRQWASTLASHHMNAASHVRNNGRPSFDFTIQTFEDSICLLLNTTSDGDKSFHERILNISVEYANQVEEDWLSFRNKLGFDMKTAS